MNGSTWVLAPLAALAASIGCGGGGDCEAIYEAEVKCRGKGGDKAEFMKACEAAKKEEPDEFAAAAKCSKESSCEAMKACGKKARAAQRGKDVAKALSAGKVKDAWEDCTLSADYYADASYKAECAKVFAAAPAKLSADERRSAGYSCSSGDDIKKVAPEFAKACADMSAGEVKSLMEAALKARDTGVRDFKTCIELERAAKDAGGDAAAKAKTLCEEADKAEAVKKGIEDAKAKAKARSSDFPYECKSLPGELDAIGTEWAKQKREELLKACYVELGAVVVDIESKEAKYGCPYRITQLKEAAAQFDLATKFPELGELLKKLPPKCNK
jgi:hypothetical protein